MNEKGKDEAGLRVAFNRTQSAPLLLPSLPNDSQTAGQVHSAPLSTERHHRGPTAALLCVCVRALSDARVAFNPSVICFLLPPRELSGFQPQAVVTLERRRY